MKCPSCGHENIPGVDLCEKCMACLSEAYLPSPAKGKFRRMVMEETVWNAIDQGQKPVILDPNDSVEKAVQAFQGHEQSCLLVVKKGKLAGIITYRDILRKAGGKHKDLKKVAVSKIMTARPIVLKKDDTVAVAINRMSVGGFRHIPIVDDEKRPIGWISVKAVLRHVSKKGRAPTTAP